MENETGDLKEKRKKDKRSDVILVGRNLAWVKKKDPELYDYILKKAEEENLTASDIITKALRYAYMERERLLEDMSAREFLAVVDRWNEVQKEFLKHLLDYVTTFMKLGFEKYSEIISAISESVKEDMEKEKKVKKVDPELLMSMITSLPSIIPQVITSLNETLRNMMNIQQTPQQT